VNIIFLEPRPFSHFAHNGFRQRVGRILWHLIQSSRVERLAYVWWNQEPFSSVLEEPNSAQILGKVNLYETRRLMIPFSRRFGLSEKWLDLPRTRKLSRSLPDMSDKPLWVWATDPRIALSARRVADALNARLVYDLIDNFAVHLECTPRQRDEYERGYRAVVRLSDKIFTNNFPMVEYLGAGKGRVKPIPNGVDWERFHSLLKKVNDEPTDMLPIPHPRVGFVGILSKETDHTLLNRVAVEIPECEVIFIGHWMGTPQPLHSRIHQLGMKSFGDIPRYTAGLDVGLSIYRIGPSTCYRDSMKVYEYLAAGKQVVATDFAGKHVLPGVNVAQSSDGFIALVRKQLAGNGYASETENRSLSVQSHAWEHRINEMLDCLTAGSDVSERVADA